MIKAFFGLIIVLVIADEAFRGGAGTTLVIELVVRAWSSFNSNLHDSIFTH
ncbi:MAG: hypothetical protein K2P68_02895 [Sphingomonas sp.]|nr:hypothetical protein [Sphingomonas sp.]